MEILKNGISKQFRGDLKRLKQEVMETAEMLGIVVTGLEYSRETVEEGIEGVNEVNIENSGTDADENLYRSEQNSADVENSSKINTTLDENVEVSTAREETATESIPGEAVPYLLEETGSEVEEGSGTNVNIYRSEGVKYSVEHEKASKTKLTHNEYIEKSLVRETFSEKSATETEHEPSLPEETTSAINGGKEFNIVEITKFSEDKTPKEVESKETVDRTKPSESEENEQKSEPIFDEMWVMPRFFDEDQRDLSGYGSDAEKENDSVGEIPSSDETKTSKVKAKRRTSIKVTKYPPKESKLSFSCQICNKFFLTTMGRHRHYGLHFAKNLKTIAEEKELYKNNKCMACLKTFSHTNAVLLHIGVRHGLINSILESRKTDNTENNTLMSQIKRKLSGNK